MRQIKLIALILAGAALFVALPYFYQKSVRQAQTIADLKSYAEAQYDTATHYKNRFGATVTQVKVLQMEKGAIEAQKKDLEKITANFDVRLKRIEQLSQTSLSAIGQFTGVIQDTVVVKDTISIAAYSFEVGDDFYKVSGIIDPTAKTISVRPELTAKVYGIVHRGKKTKKILFFRVGPRELIHEVTTDNPYVTLKVDKFIQKRKD